MPITPHNPIKNNATGTGRTKTYSGGYGYARYGLSYYGQGGGVTNQTKSPNVGVTITAGTPMGLLLAITYPTTFNLGSGWKNRSKN